MIKVLIIDELNDDCRRLAARMRDDPKLQVVGILSSTEEIVTKVEETRPDIILIGSDLHDTDCLEVVRMIMRERPTPIILLAEAGAIDASFESRTKSAGALAVAEGPSRTSNTCEDALAQRLISQLKALSQVKVIRHWHRADKTASREEPSARPAVIAVAASTGGPAALQSLVTGLAPELPCPILLVQHMTEGHAHRLADWLNSESAVRTVVASNGMLARPGYLYVAPDDRHLGITRSFVIQLLAAPPIDGFLPSATFLFESVAAAFGRRALAVIMTGMGRDGVDGLAAVRASGGKVIAQDEASCAVFGMPRAAIEAGVVDSVVPLSDLAGMLGRICGTGVRGTQCAY